MRQEKQSIQANAKSVKKKKIQTGINIEYLNLLKNENIQVTGKLKGTRHLNLPFIKKNYLNHFEDLIYCYYVFECVDMCTLTMSAYEGQKHSLGPLESHELIRCLTWLSSLRTVCTFTLEPSLQLQITFGCGTSFCLL